MGVIEQIYSDPRLMAASQAGGLLLGRVLPLVVLTPMLGGQLLPARLRIGISLLLVFVLLPSVTPAQPLELSAVQYFGLAFKEAMIGLTVSTMILLMYHTFTSMGAVVDLSRGATIANVYDPTTQQQQPVVGSFFLQAAIVLFLTLGGHHIIIEALGQSLIAMPIFETSAPAVEAQGLVLVLSLLGTLMSVALQLALPVVLVILLLDVVLGLLNKVAPQIQVYFVGLSIKSALGLAIVLLGLGLTIDLMRSHFIAVLRQIYGVMG